MQSPADTLATVATALSLYRESTALVNSLWSFFSTVALSIIGLLYSGKAHVGHLVARILIVVAFLLFAFGNSHELRQAQEIRVAASRRLQAGGSCDHGVGLPIFSDSVESLPCEIDASEALSVQAFQAVFSILVVGAIIHATRRTDQKAAREG